MAGLSLKNINKIYKGNVLAVNDFNMEIGEKEFIILVGPSGCGKSTALRMIAGLEEITSGEIYIDGKLVNGVEPKDRDVAMVFQNYALYPHMTIFDNIAFTLKMKKVKKDEIVKRVNDVAEKLELMPYLKRKPKQLSGGQRQRVALGRAMVRNPKVFLLDEPLSNLDAKLRVAMRREIVDMYHKLNTTFLYVTHDQTEAMTMGTRIVVMNCGVIQQVDTPYNLYHFPKNKFVAEFIGSPQMNIFDVIIQGNEYEIKIVIGENELKLPNRYFQILKEYIGQKVDLGIRPENIQLGKEGDCGFFVTIDSIENMGSDTFYYFKLGESKQKFSLRTSSNYKKESGDTIYISLDIEKLHFFGIKSGNAI